MKKALVFLMVLVLALAQFAIAEGESPLAGLAVKEDGTPMVLGYILNETGSGWMSTSYGYTKALWENAGGEFIAYVSDYDSEFESDSIDQLMELNADAILVLEQGRVVERGDHEALLAQKGEYYQLYHGMF